jgi:tryptophan halogenase
MIKKIKHIIVFGGGTSGWLTAAYLTNQLTSPIKITVIESTDLGPIGVGEGTQPATSRFLYDAGIMPKTWMKPSHASFKLGVEFVGWNKENFFIDNDFIENTLIGPDLRTVDYFMGRPVKEFFDWLPAYQLAKANKSPKLAGMDTNYAIPGIREFGAVHFDAFAMVDTIHDLIKDRIEYFDTKIVTIDHDESGITALIDEEGRVHTADLYIDCSGFQSLLLEKTLGVEFRSVENVLPCNRAVVIPTQYLDPEQECFPYTRATAMNAGWMFTIPTFKRTGNGYCYSDKYITPEQAEQELRDKIGDATTPARHLVMRCGSHAVTAYKNVVAVGLSAGFVEPLEATGITFTTKIVEALVGLLNHHNAVWNDAAQNTLNASYEKMVTEIVAFVWAHYYFSSKDDTEFWKAIRNQDVDQLPEHLKNIIDLFIPRPHDGFFLDKTSGFHVGHWFSLVNACGVYQDQENLLEPERENYAEYFIRNQQARVELVKEYFPNHYEFLKAWYETTDTKS